MRRLAAMILVSVSLTAQPALAEDIINYTQATTTVAADGSRVVQIPPRDKTHRRRMLVDFGLFGAGIHVGWLKPRNTQLAEDQRHHLAVGSPILNVSAGTHAVGLGTR